MKIQEEFSIKSEIFDWLEAICFSLVAIILVFTLLFRSAQVEGSSMLPNYHEGDRLVLINTALSKVETGDVVVITQPTSVGHPLIKRVIATEGQTVDINYITGEVTVDGVVLSEDYIMEPINSVPLDPIEYPFTVGEGKIFVMGDNRNASSDSRNAGIGEIDTRYILGKAIYRILPFDSFGPIV